VGEGHEGRLGGGAPHDRGPDGVGAGDQAAGSPAASRRRPLRCRGCTGAFDLPCLQDPAAFVCPSCRFKAMDPFSAVVEPKGVLKLALLAQPTLDFALDLPELRQWRRDGLAVEVRMLRLDSCKPCQAWPQSLRFVANGNEIFAVAPPEEGHKRRDVPQAISAGLKHGINSISVHIQDPRISDFVLAVVMTQPRGIPELSQQVSTCEESAALARVRALLAKQRAADDACSQEIVCLSSDTLRLCCPITMDRIVDPVRGTECQHLQCFGLEAYLTSNKQMRAFNNRWQCPVCTLVLRPPDLCRDPYMAHILASTSTEVEEVAMAGDGAWKCRGAAPVRPKLEAATPLAEAALDLDSESPTPAPGPPQQTSASSQPPATPEPSPDVAPTPEAALAADAGVGAPQPLAKRLRLVPPPCNPIGPPAPAVTMQIDLEEISDAE